MLTDERAKSSNMLMFLNAKSETSVGVVGEKLEVIAIDIHIRVQKSEEGAFLFEG